jgi:formylmethanofuran dehydrogenase subunit E
MSFLILPPGIGFKVAKSEECAKKIIITFDNIYAKEEFDSLPEAKRDRIIYSIMDFCKENKCADCGENIPPDSVLWPNEKGEPLCQMCWEKECARSWWEQAAPHWIEPETEVKEMQ